MSSLSRFTVPISSFGLSLALALPAQAQNLAIHLDGAGDGIDVPGTPSLDVQTAYTFEAWIKYEGGGPIVLRKDGYDRVSYWLNATSIWIDVLENWWHNQQAGSWCNAGNPMPAAGPWTHVAASFDGTTVTLYRNGIAVHSCGMPQPESHVGFPLRIGWGNSASGGISYLQGWLDEIRVWDVARTGPEILQTINKSIDAVHASSYPGLVGCWSFEGNADDSTGVNNGAVLGNPTYLAADDIPILDCNGNGVVDAAELAGGIATDCNSNGILDECDISSGASQDCNSNQVPDECESLTSTYCAAGTTVHGCVPTIAGEGSPSSNASGGFDIVVRDLPGQRYGTVFYGFYPFATPWAPGSTSFKCIASPVARTGVLDSGGVAGQCDGEFSVDFNAWMQANPTALGSPFVAGQVFYAQGWFRDPAAPKQTNLSNGVRFTLCD